VAAFKRAAPNHVELEILSMEPRLPGRNVPDALVRLRTGNQETLYNAEIKGSISHAIRQYLMMKNSPGQRPLLLVTSFVNPMMAEQLKQDGLEFIDTAGNAFLNRGKLFIFVKGNRGQGRLIKLPASRVFNVSGLRMIFALLCRPDLLNITYREIATATGVSLGTAAAVMAELKGAQYVIEIPKGSRRLARKKELVMRWVTAYPERLRPRLSLGRYQGEPGWWEKAAPGQWDGYWGGEVAAWRLTKCLAPQLATVYLPAPKLNDFLIGNRLRRDDRGTVEVLERFWPTEDHAAALETVHPILVYADLLASGYERNIETAKLIYDQHIVRYLRED
jgi:hypothetical protein